MTATQQEAPAKPEAAEAPAPEIESAALLAGRREVRIRHGDDTYRLKLTSNNKLILMK